MNFARPAAAGLMANSAVHTRGTGPRVLSRSRRAVLVLALALVVLSALPVQARETGRVEVVYWHKWTGYWKDMVDEICGWFNDYQDRITVKPLVVPGSGARTKFLAAVVGGDPPDLMSEWDPVIPHYAASGALMPLDDLMALTPGEKERVDAFLYPVVRKMATYDGKLYALATSMNTFRVFYNVGAFEDAGIGRAPETLEELETAIDKLFQFDERGYIARAGFELGPWQALLLFPAFGGRFYDEQTGHFTCAAPANIRALEWMCRLGRRYGVKQLRTFDLANQSYLSGATDPFASGRVAMRLHGQWSVDIFERAMAEGLPRFRYDSFAMPAPPGGLAQSTFVNGNFNIIPANARHPREAWEFMKWWTGVTDPAWAARVMVRGGWVPTSQEVVDMPAYQRYLDEKPAVRPFVEMLRSPNAVPLPVVPIQTYFNSRFSAAVDYAMWNVKTPEQALRDLDEELERELTRVLHDLKAQETRRQAARP